MNDEPYEMSDNPYDMLADARADAEAGWAMAARLYESMTTDDGKIEEAIEAYEAALAAREAGR